MNSVYLFFADLCFICVICGELFSDARWPMRYLLEVACDTLADAVAAAEGGADRIELCTALDLGGLTPSVGLYHEVREAVRLPVWVMIRPRPGDFVYSHDEIGVMARDVELFARSQPAGFVFGALNPDGRVNNDGCHRVLDACGTTPAVFHRAFDRTPDVLEALAALIHLRFRRILTSGREGTAVEGAKVIKRVRDRADGRIEVLPCGKVRAENIEALLQLTGCDQVHGAFAEPVPAGEGAGYRGYAERVRVSREQVVAARAELDRVAGLLSSTS